jgi:hypothetical protein
MQRVFLPDDENKNAGRGIPRPASKAMYYEVAV